MRFWEEAVLPFWRAHLEEAVREGAPRTTLYAWLDARPDLWRVAEDWFRAAARISAQEVVAKARVPQGASRLLDVGGGHYFSVAFCRAQPGLRALLLDLPGPLEAARATLAAEGMADCVELRAGDMFSAELGSGHDAALLFNVLHGEPAERNLALLRRVAAALRPGRMVVVLDQFAGPRRRGALGALAPMFSLAHLVALGGQAHRFEECAAWLGAAGFRAPRRG